MPRGSWLQAGVLQLSGLLVAQTPDAPPRPEQLLPPETILYVGTDDVDVLLGRGRHTPVGRILAEPEMKDFLEKPIAEFRKLVEQGVAAAKQLPALAPVDLNPEKLLAGPFGRAFLAVTHVHLPPAEAFDPAAIDLGLVVGLEARAGAVDVLALMRSVVGALAESEGAGSVTIETVQADGLSYDRIRAGGGAPPLCFANVGGLSLFTLSERTLTAIATRARESGPSLRSDPAFVRAVAATRAPATGDVVVFVQLGRLFDLVHQGVSLGMTLEGEKKGLAIVNTIFDALRLSALGPAYATSTQDENGTAVELSYTEIDPSAGGVSALFRAVPIDRGALARIPKNALSFSLSSFELAPIWDMVMMGLQLADPAIHEQVTAQIRAFELEAGGADEQGAPIWNIRRDLIGAIGGRMMSVSTPGAATMFGPGGDVVVSIETPEPARLETSLQHLFAMAGKLIGTPINFKEQMHGGAKLRVLDPMSLGPVAMVAGSLQITYSITGGRFWFATTTKALKKALDAMDAPPADNITMKPDFAARYVEPPQGAIVTSLSYGDTAANFENTYTAIMGVLPMLLMGLPQSEVGELPIDMMLLPTAETISKHLFGTVSLSYQAGAHGRVSITRGPFGVETGLVIAAGAAGAGALIGARADAARTASRPPPGRRSERAPSGDPADQARRDLAEINSAITVYVIEYGKAPATLAELVKSSPEYPEGLLGRAALPDDPWGHAYAYSTDGADGYTVWSFGPNGVDDSATGDDVVQRN